MDLTRQSDIIQTERLKNTKASVIGCGAIGSFVMLALTKMGIESIDVYDEDGVSEHNIPNQFYKIEDSKKNKFKVDAIKEITEEFCGKLQVEAINRNYTNQLLKEIVIVATDSMESRKIIWDNFLAQESAKYLIEARMGGETGIVYCVDKQELSKYKKEYEKTLYADSEVKYVPCTEKSIIYNVLLISSVICRNVKAKLTGEINAFQTLLDIKNLEIIKNDKSIY